MNGQSILSINKDPESWPGHPFKCARKPGQLLDRLKLCEYWFTLAPGHGSFQKTYVFKQLPKIGVKRSFVVSISGKDLQRVKNEIRSAIDSLSQAKFGTGGKDLRTWSAYSHIEMAVLIVKLAVGEDMLLSEWKPEDSPTVNDPAQLLREAERLLETDDIAGSLATLRAARDLLMERVKQERREASGGRPGGARKKEV